MIMRYTERTANVFIKAYEAAIAFNQDYIASEHLIAGILAEGSGNAYEALAAQGLDGDNYWEALSRINGKKGRRVELTTPPKVEELMQLLTPRTKRVLELAIFEGSRRGQDTINPEQILAGIIRESENVGFKILMTLGINIKGLYAQIFDEGRAATSTQSAKANTQNADSNQETPTLDQYGKDLTAMVREQKIDPVIGRSDEINRVMQILVRRTKNNPVLIGEPGVGKTAIAEGIAEKIVDGDMPDVLKDKRVITLDLSSMLAGAKYRGEFEERIEQALQEAIHSENVILFIDELHTIVGAGAGEGSLDAANILKPLLARGELQIVGATTLDEYRKHIEKDKALSRRFQPVMVEEPSEEEAVLILHGLRDKYEAHHGVKITDEAIDAAVDLSVRYITDRFLPDKAIDLIDEGCSKIRLSNYTEPTELRELEEELRVIEEKKQEAAEKEEFERAAELRREEIQLQEKKNQLSASWKRSVDAEHNRLTEETIAEIVSDWSGVPVTKLTEEDTEKLRDLDIRLKERVIGQDEAVDAVARAIRRGRLGLRDSKRPAGSFIFLGTTGVGKTELAKALAVEMFGDEKALVRFDMSEYMEKFDVNKFIGSPPGYVGYDEAGQLTEAVRRRPYSVILFDEIEKAHPDVFNILLQVLEDGRLTDGQGRTVNFTNTIIIMTSNIGARTLTTAQGRSIGFSVPSKNSNAVELDQDLYGGRSYDEAKEIVMEDLRKTFNPEFINRIDEIVFFRMLAQESMEEIVTIMLKDLTMRLQDIGIYLQADATAISWLAKEGADIQYGARPLRRKIQSTIEDKISELLLDQKIKMGDTVLVSATEEAEALSFETVQNSLQKVEDDMSDEEEEKN